MVFMPAFSCCTIKSIELYSEKEKYCFDLTRYFLKITLHYDDGKKKGTIIIPKVNLPIHPDPKYWGWKQEYSIEGCIPKTTLDLCGDGMFDILPDDDEMTKVDLPMKNGLTEEIEKILGYSIDIKGMRECPCKKKGDDNA